MSCSLSINANSSHGTSYNDMNSQQRKTFMTTQPVPKELFPRLAFR